MDSRVLDSRVAEQGESIRRRRQCDACDRRYTTYERAEGQKPLILKKNGQKQPFDREKLLAGIVRASAKRPIARETLQNLVNDIENRLLKERTERDSAWLGQQVLRALKALDAVAYVRFASVYRDFQDVDEFLAELERVAHER